MTPQLKRLRALAEAATPGPWHVGHISENENDVMDIDGLNGITVCEVFGNHNSRYLCTLSPVTVLKLIEAIEVLREACFGKDNLDINCVDNVLACMVEGEGSVVKVYQDFSRGAMDRLRAAGAQADNILNSIGGELGNG